MKLYERFGDKGFHTTVLTTFGVDFDAYESMALSRLRGSGCRNNLLIADQKMLTHALSGASTPPRVAGRYYSVSGATAAGVFHSKIALQLGRQKGRLIIGSANATASGLAGNLELAGVIECDLEESGAQSLIAASWAYVTRVLDHQHYTVSQQIAWLEARSPWLLRASPATDIVTLSDGTQAAWLATGGNVGIMDRFVGLIGTAVVKRLTVLSPYWDSELTALKELYARLQPEETVLLIDRKRALFPRDALTGLERTHIVDIGDFAKGRFVHAKLLIVSTGTTDHVLYGSANCTVAALGRIGFSGHNEEACIYRRLPFRSVSEALELESLLSGERGVSAADLPCYAPTLELHFDDLAISHPGVFECRYETLTWWPPASLNPMDAEIELLRLDETPLPCTLHPQANSKEGARHYFVAGADERPAFARLRFSDGRASPPAVVALVDVLRGETREVVGRGGERAAAQLEAETEEGLWLLEVLNELEAAEIPESAPASQTAKPTPSEDVEHIVFRRLDYQAFTAGCHLRSKVSAVGRNSLSGSEVSLVRVFLNRVLALESDHQPLEDPDEEISFRKLLDRGDEISDTQGALDGGNEIDEDRRSHLPEPDDHATARRLARKRRDNREQIERAVVAFIGHVHDRAAKRLLGTRDILRLRAMLTIIAAAGCGTAAYEIQEAAAQNARTTLQVLPALGSEHSWPRLLGRVLYSWFGGRKPAIHALQIEDIYDQIPDDVIECWGCCFWGLQAALLAARVELPRGLERLIGDVYLLTGLRAEEMRDERIERVMRLMGERFARRLGVGSEAIMAAHFAFAANEARRVEKR